MLLWLLFGSFWWWTLTAVAFFSIMAAVEYERPGLATFLLLGALGAFAFFGDVNVFSFILHHPGVTALYALGYFAVGAVWSVFKWWRYVANRSETYEQNKRDWITQQWKWVPADPSKPVEPRTRNAYRDNRTVEGREERYTVPKTGPAEVPAELKQAFTDYATDCLIPSVKNSKTRLTAWVAFWPVSVIWFLLSDWVRKIAEGIVMKFKAVYAKIRDRAYIDASKDLVEGTKLD